MKFRQRLRTRLIVAFTAFGAAVALLFASLTVVIRAHLENVLVGDALSENLEDYVSSFYKDPSKQLYEYKKISGLTLSKRRFANAPFAWRELENGVHDVREIDAYGNEVFYKLAIRKDPETWFFLRYDLSEEQLSERQLIIWMAVAVTLLSLLSLLVGLWASRRVISPVIRLAQEIASVDRSAAARLSVQFADDEVGYLASTLEQYSIRLTEVVTKDREFNADVSHELRTPIAVIRGAVELALGQTDLSPSLRSRLERIDRASRQCGDIIESLLLLSRDQRIHGTSRAWSVAEQILEYSRAGLGAKSLNLVLEGDEEAIASAPDAVVSVILSNLIGNACRYSTEGTVKVTVHSWGVEVDDEGPGISSEDAARVFERGFRGTASGTTRGAGIGLAIVKRLCDRYSWSVSLRGTSRGARATLRWSEGAQRRPPDFE